MEQVFQAQLSSQSFRLGEVCERLIRAYDTETITVDVQDDLMSLANVLRDAANVADKLKDAELTALCNSLSNNVDKIADRYMNCLDADVYLIKKITTAFKAAMTSQGPVKDSLGIVADVVVPDDGEPEALELF